MNCLLYAPLEGLPMLIPRPLNPGPYTTLSIDKNACQAQTVRAYLELQILPTSCWCTWETQPYWLTKCLHVPCASSPQKQ
jgi:hypothetical protein